MPRFIHLNGGFALNVESVTRIEYLNAAEHQAEVDPAGEPDRPAVVIRYDGGPGIYINVDDHEWAAVLIAALVRELANGQDTIVDPYAIKTMAEQIA